MTDQQRYEKAKDMIFGELVSKDGTIIYRPMIEQLNSYEDIGGYFPAIYWLSELYIQMVRKSEITEIRHLKSSHKLILWASVCTARPQSPKWVRIQAAWACYMWDLIKQSENAA